MSYKYKLEKGETSIDFSLDNNGEVIENTESLMEIFTNINDVQTFSGIAKQILEICKSNGVIKIKITKE